MGLRAQASEGGVRHQDRQGYRAPRTPGRPERDNSPQEMEAAIAAEPLPDRPGGSSTAPISPLAPVAFRRWRIRGWKNVLAALACSHCSGVIPASDADHGDLRGV